MHLGVLVTCPNGWMPSSVGVVDDPISMPPAAAVVPSDVSALAAGLLPTCLRHSMVSQEAKAWRLLVPPAQPKSKAANHQPTENRATVAGRRALA
jgi:hypothetical protein